MHVSVRARAGNAVTAPYMVQSNKAVVPYEIGDAVEMWARQWGRHGSIGWNPAMQCYVIELTLRGDDPRMRSWQESKLRHEPKECIPLHYQPHDHKGQASVHYKGINIHELGVSGVLEILNRGNTTSGRGEFTSSMQAAQSVADRNDKLKHDMRAAATSNARDRSKDMRRQILGLPLVSVLTNIGAGNGDQADE